MFINISAYKFVRLVGLPGRKAELLGICHSLQLKGTILLSPEGINVFLAGSRASIDQIINFFEDHDEYRGLPIKESPSKEQPHTRMLVRIKQEIISLGVDGIEPGTSPKLKPHELKQWLDEGREVTLLDVRNDYEVRLGTFRNAQPIGIDHFRDFPQAVRRLPDAAKETTLVMFCTGGIRCEKAGPFMEREGFRHVYQLDGGILRYFEECGEAHYLGDCFVFDQRVTVDAALQETDVQQCYACRHPLTIVDQQSPRYEIGKSCPYCFQTSSEQMHCMRENRNRQLREFTTPLPGSIPYDNHRPLNVPLRYDGQNLVEFLTSYHSHLDPEYWRSQVEQGRVLCKGAPVDSNLVVGAGQRLVHLLAGTIEPDINPNIRIIHEDEHLVAVDKPAPLPMHPCGRFNRNSLSYILNAVYRGEKIRMIHRLDANTSGVVLLSRKRQTAQLLQTQFEKSLVKKLYLARICGHPTEEAFRVELPISAQPSEIGSRRIDENGLPAMTDFRLIKKLDDGTALVSCCPRTGRTNQIRIHLWSLGTPIVNDPTYLKHGQIGESQTLGVEDDPMCLHAFRLQFRHPVSGEAMCLVADWPDWFCMSKP